jgi:hypothetical protein
LYIVGGSEMKEYIEDLTSLGEFTDEELEDEFADCFADHGCIHRMERMLLDHIGKKIRIRVTVMKE